MEASNFADLRLVADESAVGLFHAVEEVFLRTLRQRRLAHKIRKLQSNVPGALYREFKRAAVFAYQAGSPKPVVMLKADCPLSRVLGPSLGSSSYRSEDPLPNWRE